MRTIRYFAIGLFCAAIFSASAFAQAGAQPAAGKIVVINSFQFADEKAGITKFIAASKALNTEFTPLQNELQTMSTRLQALAKEIEAIRSKAGTVPIDEKAYQAKVDEGERLQLELKRKQEDAKARLEKRQQTLLGPVMQDVGKALIDYAKQKGYLFIFDIAKDDAGFLVAVGDDKADVTKDFIAYYNAKP